MRTHWLTQLLAGNRHLRAEVRKGTREARSHKGLSNEEVVKRLYPFKSRKPSA